MRTFIIPLLLITSVLCCVSFTAQNDDHFVELKGQVLIPKTDPSRSYKLILLRHHQVLDSAEVVDDEEFLLRIEKSTMYSLRIIKTGYLPMVITLNTHSPELLIQQRFDFSNACFVSLYGFNLSLSLLEKTLMAKKENDELSENPNEGF